MDQLIVADLSRQSRLGQLLEMSTGVEATVEDRPDVRASSAVMIDEAIGTKTTQRLSLQARGDGLALCTWPAELKPQAQEMYQAKRVDRLLNFLGSGQQSWQARPTVHLAYRSAPSRQRVYLHPHLEISEYVHQWLAGDLDRVGAHHRDHIWEDLWPWLLERRYADLAKDKQPLAELLVRLGRRPVLLRPAIALERLRPWADAVAIDRSGGLADEIRSAIIVILTALDEPLPPACRSSSPH
jgi:hypothetical protein